MENSKVFMFPEGNNSSIDPALLMALNNNGGFGGNGNWMWIIFLFFLYPLMRNGWGGFGGNGGNGFGDALSTGYLSNQINNGTGRDLLMQAINGNGAAIGNLATTLNSDINSVKTALTNVMSAISSVGNQVGMTAMQTINAVQAGNMSLAQQIAQCCCDNKLLVTTQGYENQIATLNQTNALQNAINNNTVKTQEGFTTVTFQNQTQQAATQRAISDGVQGIKDATNAQTTSILAKLDAIEDARKDREINNLTAQLASVTAKAEREAELAPIMKQLDTIQCHQPNTITLPYSNAMAIPACSYYNAMFNAYGLNPGAGSIWS